VVYVAMIHLMVGAWLVKQLPHLHHETFQIRS
jgi:hypothetical protein